MESSGLHLRCRTVPRLASCLQTKIATSKKWGGGTGRGGAVFQQPRVSRFTRTTEASFPWPLKATYHISGTGFFTSSFGGKKDFLKGTDIGWFVVSNPG